MDSDIDGYARINAWHRRTAGKAEPPDSPPDDPDPIEDDDDEDEVEYECEECGAIVDNDGDLCEDCLYREDETYEDDDEDDDEITDLLD